MLFLDAVLIMGEIATLENNTIKVPFVTMDTTAKSSTLIPTSGTLQDKLIKKINLDSLPDGTSISSATATVGISVEMVEVDFTPFFNFEPTTTSDIEAHATITSALDNAIYDYANSVGLDDNGRVAFTSFNPYNGIYLELKGGIDYNENGDLSLQLVSVKDKVSGKSLDIPPSDLGGA